MGLADKFELAPDLVPKVKLGIHILHTIIAFVIFVLEIVLFRKPKAEITGNNGWTFAMVWDKRYDAFFYTAFCFSPWSVFPSARSHFANVGLVLPAE